MAFDPSKFGIIAPETSVLPPKKSSVVVGITAKPVETKPAYADLAKSVESAYGAEPSDDEAIEEMGGFTLMPDAVCYRTADQQCKSCEYLQEGNQCKVLNMVVEDDAGCNAHESKSEDMEMPTDEMDEPIPAI